MKRLMISAMSSSSGKTLVSCGLMNYLTRAGMGVQAFKCGPDYIDPMFHTRVLGIPSRSLDLYLQGAAGVCETLRQHPADLQLLEGAMGFYDGIGGTDSASAWDLARKTDTPVVLVLRPSGQSLTLAAQVRGMLDFRPESHIVGLFLNCCRPKLYAHLRPVLERETGLPVVGYLPPMEEARLPSRHLGLLTAEEITDFSRRFEAIGTKLEKTLNLELLLSLGAEVSAPAPERTAWPPSRCRIGVARDRAFCFCYQDSLDALGRAGAELVYFSPLEDAALPAGLDGLYLGGGYPELYARELSENVSMRHSVLRALERNMPTLAECGGFLYLQQSLEDNQGRDFPMVGALPGRGFRTDRLQRFGYTALTQDRDSMLFRAGEPIPAHGFHRWDCTHCGGDLTAVKPVSGKSWHCGFTGPRLYAGFPHLYLGGVLARRFVAAALEYRKADQR